MWHMRILERNDLVKLLWIEVEKAGSQTAWAKMNGIDRSHINKVLHGVKPLQTRSSVPLDCGRSSYLTEKMPLYLRF